MEVRDGFIVGIFNYCDRWCETCAFTSRCRLFADVAEIEAKLDPNLKQVVDAPPLPEEIPPPPPQWVKEMIQDMNAAADDPTLDTEEHRRQPPPEHLLIEARADDYFTRAHAWLSARAFPLNDVADPCAVINWFHLQIVVKVHRAIRGLAEDQPSDRDWPADYDGSAKVALLGIERSHTAWLDATERGVIARSDAEGFIADLVWLGDALECVFPNARAFVRPGFDEPDEVSMLVAREGAL